MGHLRTENHDKLSKISRASSTAGRTVFHRRNFMSTVKFVSAGPTSPRKGSAFKILPLKPADTVGRVSRHGKIRVLEQRNSLIFPLFHPKIRKPERARILIDPNPFVKAN